MKRFVLVLATAIAAASPEALVAGGVRVRLLTTIYADAADVGLKAPEGVAAPDGQRLFAADTGNGRIVEYAVAAEAITARAVLQIPEVPFPTRLAMKGKSDLYVLDGKSRRIARVVDGAFRGWVEPKVEGAFVPRSLRVDGSGSLWILDVAGSRVVVSTPDGTVSREVALPRGTDRFYADLDVDARGNLYVLESLGRRILSVPSGKPDVLPFGESFAADLDYAGSIAVDGSGRVFIADLNGGGLVILGADGSFQGRESGHGWKSGLLRYPVALALDPSGRLYVAERGNNRVTMFGLVE